MVYQKLPSDCRTPLRSNCAEHFNIERAGLSRGGGPLKAAVGPFVALRWRLDIWWSRITITLSVSSSDVSSTRKGHRLLRLSGHGRFPDRARTAAANCLRQSPGGVFFETEMASDGDVVVAEIAIDSY